MWKNDEVSTEYVIKLFYKNKSLEIVDMVTSFAQRHIFKINKFFSMLSRI